MDFHTGCYCYRDAEAAAARESGVEVRCGGDLPCSCMHFWGDLGGPPDDPLVDDWTGGGGDEWAETLMLKLREGETDGKMEPVARKRAAVQTDSSLRAGVGCSCRHLHIMDLKRKRCCGDQCQCHTGDCSCPAGGKGKCCDLESGTGSRLRGIVNAAKNDADVVQVDNNSNISGDSVVAQELVSLLPPGPESQLASQIPARSSCCRSTAAPVTALVNTGVIAVATREAGSVGVGVAAGAGGAGFVCSTCGRGFGRRDELEAHEEKKHGKDRPYTCSMCTSTFLFKQNRDRHILEVHHGNRPHQCPRNGCTAAFKNSSGLKQHMRTVHDKERPFKCEQCSSSFGQRNHLSQHILVIHQRQKLFRCEVCNTSFSNRGNLNQHTRRKHSAVAHGRTRGTQ